MNLVGQWNRSGSVGYVKVRVDGIYCHGVQIMDNSEKCRPEVTCNCGRERWCHFLEGNGFYLGQLQRRVLVVGDCNILDCYPQTWSRLKSCVPLREWKQDKTSQGGFGTRAKVCLVCLPEFIIDRLLNQVLCRVSQLVKSEECSF